MKLVVAIVRTERLSAVLEELFRADVQGLTISRVQGHGGEREQVETYRGMTVKMELSEKIRLEIGVSNHFVEPTVKAVLKAARTGSVGDGKIFVLPVEKIYRIRTGRRGPGCGHACGRCPVGSGLRAHGLRLRDLIRRRDASDRPGPGACSLAPTTFSESRPERVRAGRRRRSRGAAPGGT